MRIQTTTTATKGTTATTERVAPIKGATEFLLACGFKYKVLQVEDSEERFFVLPKEMCSDHERLDLFKNVLVSITDLKAKIDRCLTPSPTCFGDVLLQPHALSTLLNFMLPVEYLIGEMYFFQEIIKAKQSDPDHIWSQEHLTGSCAEGICIPLSLLYEPGCNSLLENWKTLGSDLDIMTVKETFATISDEQIPIFDIIRSGNDPRYFLLRLTEQWKQANATFSKSVYLHQPFLLAPAVFTKMLTKMLGPIKDEDIHERIHGPARQLFTEGESFFSLDKTVVFEHPNAWPDSAMDWLIRPRKSGWPSSVLVQDIFDSGCHLAPMGIGRRASEPIEREEYISNPSAVAPQEGKEVDEAFMDEREWRISFSLAENKLGQSLSPGQRRIMVLLKIIKKAYLNDHDVISTYLLKNILFWECENRENGFWREDNSTECLLSVLDRLVECLKKRDLPHYIIPESNLLMAVDPVKLDEAAKTILELRERIVQKTVSFLSKLNQSVMFQPREFVSDLHEVIVQNKENTNEESDKLIFSLCQFYKKVIVDEHRSNSENEMKGQLIMSIINCCICMLGILEELFSESIFLQSSVNICDLHSLFLKYEDAFKNQMAKMEHVFGELEIMSKSNVSDLVFKAHFCYLARDTTVVVKELYEKVLYSSHLLKSIEYGKEEVSFPSREKDREGLFQEYAVALLPFIQKHKNKILYYAKELCFQLGHLVKLIFSSVSPLRLRVHESLLARGYCKLWFSKNGKRSKHNKDRESFALFVKEDIKSYPLDEEFIKLALAFFDGMIMGRDSCEIVPETAAMKQVKEIQKEIAHEGVKFCKTAHLFVDDLVKDNGAANDLVEIVDGILASFPDSQ